MINGDWIKFREAYGVVTRPLSGKYIEVYLADLGKRIVSEQELEPLEEAPAIPDQISVSQWRALFKAANEAKGYWGRPCPIEQMPQCRMCRR